MLKQLGIIVALAACVPVPIPVPTSGGQVALRQLPSQAAPDAAFDQMLNAARRNAIGYNANLAAVGRAHAADMEQRKYFAHASPEGVRAGARAQAAGIPSCGIGENIAQGQKSSQDVFAAWMTSPGHRKNMLNPRMSHYGLGRADDSWVLMLYAPC